jgi:hypothetical protein
MSPYTILVYLVIGAAIFISGVKVGVDHEVAGQARAERLVASAKEEMQTAAAEAIAKIKPKYTTIQNEVQREIHTETVYADCRHSPDGLRLVNQALGTKPIDNSKLSRTDPPK